MLDEVAVAQTFHISHSVWVCVASQLEYQPADPTVEKLQWLITFLNSLILSPDLRGNSYLPQPADPFPLIMFLSHGQLLCLFFSFPLTLNATELRESFRAIRA